jgi:hypothetical protein
MFYKNVLELLFTPIPIYLYNFPKKHHNRLTLGDSPIISGHPPLYPPTPVCMECNGHPPPPHSWLAGPWTIYGWSHNRLPILFSIRFLKILCRNDSGSVLASSLKRIDIFDVNSTVL